MMNCCTVESDVSTALNAVVYALSADAMILCCNVLFMHITVFVCVVVIRLIGPYNSDCCCVADVYLSACAVLKLYVLNICHELHSLLLSYVVAVCCVL